MDEKIYRKNNQVCIEREGVKLWFNLRLINKMIAFHEKELKSFYKAKRHLTPAAPDSEGRCDAQHCKAVVGGEVCNDCKIL